MLESSKSKDLEKRLSLYQVFLRIHDRNPSLLNEILSLENLGTNPQRGNISGYIQGWIQSQQAYLVTNLPDGKTQILQQPQGIWLIGRDRQSAIQLNDQRLSRRHAVIQYIPDRGFYLIDLKSSNGSFVNGESVRKKRLLKDGDRIRVSSLMFSFFTCQQAQFLKPVPAEVLQFLSCEDADTDGLLLDETVTPADEVNPSSRAQDDTSVVPRPINSNADRDRNLSTVSQLNPVQKAQILDRYLKNHARSDRP